MPLLDHHVVELALQVPGPEKLRHGVTKCVLPVSIPPDPSLPLIFHSAILLTPFSSAFPARKEDKLKRNLTLLKFLIP